jgi:hypothetical protein
VSRTVAWTGHRPDLFRDVGLARQAVDRAARDVIEAGAERFLVGGQRGVDTWAALSAIAGCITFSLILPLPLDDFTHEWVHAERDLLLHTMSHAVEVRVANGYTERNQQLAWGADLLVAVWVGIAGGGTAETIEQARLGGTPIREILLEPSATASEASGRGI